MSLLDRAYSAELDGARSARALAPPAPGAAPSHVPPEATAGDGVVDMEAEHASMAGVEFPARLTPPAPALPAPAPPAPPAVAAAAGAEGGGASASGRASMLPPPPLAIPAEYDVYLFRFLFDAKNHFIASLVNDSLREGVHTFSRSMRYNLWPHLLVEKVGAAEHLNPHYSTVYRGVPVVTGNKTMRGQLTYNIRKGCKKPMLSRILRYRTKDLRVRFSHIEAIGTYPPDDAQVYQAAASIFQPAFPGQATATAEFARANGLVLGQETADKTRADFVKLGLTKWQARVAEACEAAGAGGEARVAFEPWFAPVRSAGLASPNARVRSLAAAASRMTPAKLVTLVEEPLARDAALDGFAFPFLVSPVEDAGPGTRFPLVSLAPTGLYRPTYQDEHKTSAVVHRVRGRRDVVMGVVMGGFYTPGGGLRDLDRNADHFSMHPSLDWASTFYNRVDAAAFDGDAEWSDINLVRALALARKAAFVFTEPGGELAAGLVRRAREAVRVAA